MFKKAPSWSIKGKKKSQLKIDTPSPFHYHPSRTSAHHQPAWKIGTQKRNKTILQIKPDPASYHIESYESKKFGKFGKEKKLVYQRKEIPDSAQYSPNYKFIEKKSVGVKIGQSAQKEKPAKTPGPGQYSSNNKNMNKSKKGAKFMRQKRFLGTKTDGPSPAEYSPNNKFTEKSVSFTKQSKFVDNLNHTSPGPGQYNQKDMFSQSNASQKGYSIISRRTQKNLTENPGPGAYDPIHQHFSESPKHSFGSKYAEKLQQKNPGPSDYFLTEPSFHQSKGCSIGKEERKTFERNKKNPGPGQYHPLNLSKSAPKYSIGLSTLYIRQNTSPGPGAYSPNKQFVKSRPQSAKIGKSQRNTDSKQKNPGPGQYQNRIIRPQTAKTVFGKAERLKLKTFETPGPGQYESTTIFGSIYKPLMLR